MAGRKDAKQKAGPRGQIERNRVGAESSAGTKNTPEGAGREQPRACSKGCRKEKRCRGTLKVKGSLRNQV
jgi:hypothetical protein